MSAHQTSAGRAQFAGLRSQARARSTFSDYARYDAQKAAWASQNPDATPAQYQDAMRAIAEACGV